MNQFLILAFLFFIGCILGWGIEVFFRRFNQSNTTKKWLNPGFLTGPYLPLYGFGLCVLYLLSSLEPYLQIQNVALRKILLFIIMAICMTVIEYITGAIFTNKMHVKLWDYSTKWLNYKGIICPEFSFFWALLSAVYYIFVTPHILNALEWFSNNLTFSFFIGMFYGILIIDVCYSFKIVNKIHQFADENNILVRYENFKEHIRQNSEENKEKYKFMFAFNSNTSLLEHLKKYVDKQPKAVSVKKHFLKKK